MTIPEFCNKTLDLGIVQDEMIHLQFDELGNELYFNMDKTIYTIDTNTGSLTNITNKDSKIVLPSGNFTNSSFYITKDKFYFIENESKLTIYDRVTKNYSYVSLENGSIEYRALVTNLSNYDDLYTLSLNVNGSQFRIDHINSIQSTYSTKELENANCHILWFQARYHHVNSLYSCLPYDHNFFPYFMLISPIDGKITKYNTPSHVGQCLLK